MKTDAQLQKDIIDELRWEPRISDREIGSWRKRSAGRPRRDGLTRGAVACAPVAPSRDRRI